MQIYRINFKSQTWLQITGRSHLTLSLFWTHLAACLQKTKNYAKNSSKTSSTVSISILGRLEWRLSATPLLLACRSTGSNASPEVPCARLSFRWTLTKMAVTTTLQRPWTLPPPISFLVHEAMFQRLVCTSLSRTNHHHHHCCDIWRGVRCVWRKDKRDSWAFL